LSNIIERQNEVLVSCNLPAPHTNLEVDAVMEKVRKAYVLD